MAENQIQKMEGQQSPMVAMIERVVTSPSINVDTMERMFALMERQQAREAEMLFNQAMAAAQAEMLPVVKAGKSDKGKYARLDDINQVVVPILGKHGLSISFSTPAPRNPDNVAVACRLSHAGGHSRDFPPLEAPPDNMGAKGTVNKTGVQAVGSTITYLQRYAIRTAINVVLDDDSAPDNSPPPAVAKITETDANELRAGIDETGTDMTAFLAAYKIDSLTDLPLAMLADARNAIAAKRKRLAKEAKEAAEKNKVVEGVIEP